MNGISKKATELSLVSAIEKLVVKKKNGRLNGLLEKLAKEANNELDRIYGLNRVEIDEIGKNIYEFAVSTGWLGKQRHLCTIVSFCLAMLDQSEFKYNQRITGILNEIYDYFDRVGKAPYQCNWAGSLAMEKWLKVTGDKKCSAQ